MIFRERGNLGRALVRRAEGSRLGSGVFWQYLDNWSGIYQKIDFFPSTDSENSLDFSRLKTSNSGTVFAFIQFLLTHSD